MKTLTVLINKEDMFAVEFVSGSKGYSVNNVLEDGTQIASYLRKNHININVIVDAFSVVRGFPIKREKLNSRKAIKEFLLERRVPLDEETLMWDAVVINKSLNLFTFKKDALDNVNDIIQEKGIETHGLMLKVPSLYNYFNYTTGFKHKNFFYICLTGSVFNVLIVNNGRIYSQEIPSLGIEEVADEIKRNLEYLQAQEGISQEVLNKVFITAEDNLVAESLKDHLACDMILVESKVAGKEKVIDKTGYFPVIFGSCLDALKEKDKRYIHVRIGDISKWKKIVYILSKTIKENSALIFMILFSVIFGLHAVFIADLQKANVYIKSREETVKKRIPEYNNLLEKVKPLADFRKSIERDVKEHTYIVKAVGVIGSYLGDLEVKTFKYEASDMLIIEMDLHSKSYVEVSEYLKKLRGEGLFTKVVPLSSESVKNGQKEFIHFKIRIEK